MVNLGRRLSQLVNPATVRFQSASIDFGKFGFSAIKHPPLEAMRYSMFAIPHHESFMSATDYDKLLAGLTRVSFAEKETGVFDDRQRYEATTANFETMWMGWHDVGDKLHRYVVKRYPKEKWYLLQRDIASVYCAVALGVGEFAVKSHYYIRGEDAYFVRRFIRGVDGLHAINDPQKYSPAFVSNDALALLFVAYRVLKGDPDAGNPRNVVLADNSKVGFEMAGTSKGPSLVMVDNETTFANNQLFLDRVVPMMGIQWKPNDPFFGSVGWRHEEVQLVGASKFID
ncbi:hypothetical protein EBR57_10470, partial [bacterium]|nr:hypothetical protein [bacterium]